MDTHEIIVSNIKDAVGDLLYYDRKEDEHLPLGVIEGLVKNGQITIDEMVEVFRSELTRQLDSPS